MSTKPTTLPRVKSVAVAILRIGSVVKTNMSKSG